MCFLRRGIKTLAKRAWNKHLIREGRGSVVCEWSNYSTTSLGSRSLVPEEYPGPKGIMVVTLCIILALVIAWFDGLDIYVIIGNCHKDG